VALLFLSTLVECLGYDAGVAALRHHAPAAPGVGGVLASPVIPVVPAPDPVPEPVGPTAVAVPVAPARCSGMPEHMPHVPKWPDHPHHPACN
jgi:hypothetical protein